jgi:pyruvate/2-oxoglutarate dehydrogenase complex dihydrolipoamide dehydrogenase (E3) component
MPERFDVVCVGGGTAGMTAARAAHAKGKRVALVEREARLGGDCTFWGCVPSKALIELARAVHEARALGDIGLGAGELDFAAVMARKDRLVDAIAHDERAELFERAGIRVLRGDARFEAADRLRVGEEIVRAERVVLATGTDPAVPPIPGLRETPHLTNRSIFDLRRLPARLLVLGGGALGLELAQAFRRFGSEVTVVEVLDRLLPREDAEAGAAIEAVLRAEGVTLELGASAERVRRDGETTVVTVRGRDGSERDLRADALLVAVGRTRGGGDLGLGAAGIATDDRGFVRVDARLRTTAGTVYAAGDVSGGYLFTHVAAYEGRIAGVNAAGARAKADYRVVPWVTFTAPEVARVGMTEADARAEHGDRVEAVRFPMAQVDRARILGEPDGFVKLVTLRRGRLGRATGGRLLGAHVVGPRAGEALHEAVLAMRARAFTGRLAQAIHAYPTVSIGLQQAAAQLFPDGRAVAPPAETWQDPSAREA